MSKITLNEIKSPYGRLGYKVTDENIELTEIFVEPRQRRKGIGTNLVRELERIAIDRSKACIYVFTRDSNKSAQEFYKAIGFQKVCDIPGFYRSEGAEMYIKKIA